MSLALSSRDTFSGLARALTQYRRRSVQTRNSLRQEDRTFTTSMEDVAVTMSTHGNQSCIKAPTRGQGHRSPIVHGKRSEDVMITMQERIAVKLRSVTQPIDECESTMISVRGNGRTRTRPSCTTLQRMVNHQPRPDRPTITCD